MRDGFLVAEKWLCGSATCGKGRRGLEGRARGFVVSVLSSSVDIMSDVLRVHMPCSRESRAACEYAERK